MSFINWGNETPEQREIRRRMEENMMFEQAAYNAALAAATAAGASAGGPLRGLFGVATDGLIYKLDNTESNWQYDYLPFPTQTVICLNTDDNKLYAALDFDDTYFLSIDKVTRELSFFDNNISDYVTKGASSLYYEGNDSFIYLDNYIKKSNVSTIVRIEVDKEEGSANASVVSEVDSADSGYLLRNLFLYDGQTWAISISTEGPTQVIIGPFDIDEGQYIYSNILIPSLNETRVDEILSVSSTVEHRGTLYSAIIFVDSESGDPTIGLFKVDTETGGALAPYYVSFVKDLILENHEGVGVLSIFNY